MSGQLSLISGVVSEMNVYAGEEDFFRSTGQQTLGVGAAAGLAAAGLAGAAVGASMAASGGGDPVEFFSCKVGDRVIKGRFSKASFKNGDDMQFVVESESGCRLIALAARRANDRVLWMEPHASRGVSAHRAFSIRAALWIALALLPFGLLAVWGTASRSRDVTDASLFFGTIAACMIVLMAVYSATRFYFQWLPTSRGAERIFAMLGYADPARVDLPRDHRRYCKAHAIGWPYLIEGNGNWIYHYLETT